MNNVKILVFDFSEDRHFDLDTTTLPFRLFRVVDGKKFRIPDDVAPIVITWLSRSAKHRDLKDVN